MKKILLIIILFTAFMYPQIRVSSMDSITTLVNTDLFWINKDVGASTFGHRQLSWSNLKTNTNAYTIGLSNTFTGINTFNGATFSAGSHGGVTFSDSLDWVTAYGQFLFPKSEAALSWVGSGTVPYDAVYSNSFVLMNASENDSVTVSYDDSTITFDKKITVSELDVTSSFTTQDSTTFDGIALSQTSYSPGDVGDSVITLSLASSIELDPPGSMSSPGIEKLDMQKAGNGQFVVITNRQAYTIVIQDSEADGNLYLAGDFSMGQWYSITLMYNSNIGKWIEISRSSN